MAVTLDRAVVVGASMAGLLAACALSGHCSEVVVVERDRLSPTTQQRRGVPQARHVHALLARGREVLEQYFPGFTAEVLERGGLTADAVQGGRFFMGGDFLLSYDSGLTLLCASRPLLEAVTRERVARLDNVRFVDDTTAVDLTAREGCVTGLLTRPAQGGEQQQLASSLVVGATGRSAGGLRWLAELGYAEPAEERIEVDLTYVRRTFRRRPHHLDGARFLMITPQPPGLRAAAVFAQEDDLWRVTLAGYLGEQPPRDLEGFRQYAAGSPTPEVGDLLAAAEPVDEPATAHFPASRRRRFDRMTRHPDGFLAFGDALCSFNPVYGQGMTVAALESLALRRVLQEGGAASLARLTLRLPRSSTCRGRWPPAAICAFRRYPAHGRCATGSSTPTSTGSSSPLVTTGSSRTRSHGRTTCSTRRSPCCGPPSAPACCSAATVPQRSPLSATDATNDGLGRRLRHGCRGDEGSTSVIARAYGIAAVNCCTCRRRAARRCSLFGLPVRARSQVGNGDRTAGDGPAVVGDTRADARSPIEGAPVVLRSSATPARWQPETSTALDLATLPGG